MSPTTKLFRRNINKVIKVLNVKLPTWSLVSLQILSRSLSLSLNITHSPNLETNKIPIPNQNMPALTISKTKITLTKLTISI